MMRRYTAELQVSIVASQNTRAFEMFRELQKTAEDLGFEIEARAAGEKGRVVALREPLARALRNAV
jgi:hypothetical protein